MFLLANLTAFFTHVLHIARIQDLIEILFLASVIYYFLRWLSTDKQKNLVAYFYGYSFCLFSAYYSQCYTISTILLCCAPLMLVFFIIVHQEQLQKNFITLKRLQPFEDSSSWFNEFTSACLGALNNNKELLCVIEKHDRLIEFITVNYTFYADFKKSIFDIVLEKHVCSSDAMIWINHEGKLVAINASWKHTVDEQWITQEARMLHKWKQDGLLITSKTDALIFKITPLTRSFDIIFKGKLLENLEPEQAFELLKRSLLVTKDHEKSLKYSFQATKSNSVNADL